MEVLRRNTSLAMISTAGDALIHISTMLFTGLMMLQSEIISEISFPMDYLIRHKETFSYSGQ